MKSLNFFEKIVFLINSLVAVALLIGYLLPHVPPKYYPPLAVLTLIMPVFVGVNLCFVLYWALRLKRQILLSLIVVGLMFLQDFTLFSFKTGDEPKADNPLTILSYNVKQFGIVHYRFKDSLIEELNTFLEQQDADVVCLQEYSNHHYKDNIFYPYYYQGLDKEGKTLQNILSKYPIVDQGSLDFKSTWNNGIFVDIVKNEDTVRVYNLHMQSLAITPKVEEIRDGDKKKLVKRISDAFAKQAEQTKLFLDHRKKSPYKTVVAGDFNNTIFSYTYNKIRGTMQDAFAEAGSGYGGTYMFDFIPLRIDFILADRDFKVLDFKNHKVPYSDHYPIEATLDLP